MIHSKKLGFRFTVALSLLVLTITFGLQTSFAHNPQLKNGFLVTSGNQILRFSADKHQIGRLSLGFSAQQTVVNEESDMVYAAGSGVLQSYRLSDGSLLSQKNISGIVALAHDSARNIIYALNQEKHSIQLIDGKDLEVRSQIRLQNKPLDLAFNSQSDSLLVALDDQTIRELSASTAQETRSITDLDAPARKIVVSQKLDLLLVQHEKWVSVYNLNTLKFKDYLPLEGHPSRILVDEQNAQIFVQLSDEPDSVAVFSQTLKLVDWISTAKRLYQGRKVDASTMMLDSATGEPVYYDAKSQTLFSRDETLHFGAEEVPNDPPVGVTPGPDILVNPNIDKGAQIQPNVEFDGSGNFVITWTDDAGNDGSGQGVFAREFNFDSTPATNEYQINKVTKGDQGTSTVHVNSDGDFTIAWRDANETDGDQFGVYMRQFAKGGTAKADDILVPQTTTGRQMAPSVTGDPGGKVIAAWSGPDDGSGRGTWTRLFDASGAPITNEMLVNTSTAGNTWAVDVNANNTGEFVVVWRDDTNDRIRGRKFHSDGTPVAASDFQAGPFGTGSPKNFEPSVGVFEDGSFIVAWRESSAGGICAEKFDTNQNPIGTPFVVTSKMTEQQYSTSIAVAPDNSFVVVWRDSGYSSDNIVARMFDTAGVPLGPDFIVPENFGNDEFECSVGSDNAGNFVVVWKDRGGPTSIAARYFMVGPPPVPMTVDSATPNTADRGASLTVNVVGTQFPTDATANFNDPGITVNSTTFIDAQHLDVNITITATAFLGLHDITVNSSTGNATGNDLFAVTVGGGYPAPDITDLAPPSGDQGKTINVDINGTDFANDAGLSANFGPDITVNSLQFISGIQIRANITIASTAAVGLRDVTVTNPGGASDTCTLCFDVIFNPTLYSDDFSDGDASDWIVEKGSWSAAGQALTNTSGDGKPRIISPFIGCGVCSFEVDVKRGQSQGATLSVYGWWVDSKNYVELLMNKDKGKWILKHKINGDLVNKSNVKGTINTGQFYHVKLANDGTNFTATIDGGLTVSIPVTGTPLGTTAFKVKGTIGTFDNVVVLP